MSFVHAATALLALCQSEKYSKRSEMVAILSGSVLVAKTCTFLTSGSSGEMSRFTSSFLFGSSRSHKKGGPLSHRELTFLWSLCTSTGRGSYSLLFVEPGWPRRRENVGRPSLYSRGQLGYQCKIPP